MLLFPTASLAKLQVQYEEDKSLLPSLLSAEVSPQLNIF